MDEYRMGGPRDPPDGAGTCQGRPAGRSMDARSRCGAPTPFPHGDGSRGLFRRGLHPGHRRDPDACTAVQSRGKCAAARGCRTRYAGDASTSTVQGAVTSGVPHYTASIFPHTDPTNPSRRLPPTNTTRTDPWAHRHSPRRELDAHGEHAHSYHESRQPGDGQSRQSWTTSAPYRTRDTRGTGGRCLCHCTVVRVTYAGRLCWLHDLDPRTRPEGRNSVSRHGR